MTIAGPREKELTNLRAGWKKWRETLLAKAKPTKALATTLDESVPNLSSLIALVEHGGHKVLLTGDARADFIYKGLVAAGKTDAAGKLRLDILKMPHHGSIRNITEKFLTDVPADHYVASGDGTYGNPDRATLELIAKVHKAVRPTEEIHVHLTYDAASCDQTHEQWRKGRKGYPPFNPLTDTIKPIVDGWKAGGKIKVHDGEPVKIDL